MRQIRNGEIWSNILSSKQTLPALMRDWTKILGKKVVFAEEDVRKNINENLDDWNIPRRERNESKLNEFSLVNLCSIGLFTTDTSYGFLFFQLPFLQNHDLEAFFFT